MMHKATHCYVGNLPCGCGVAIVADMPGYEKDTASDVARMIAAGYHVSRLESGDAAGAKFLAHCDRYPHEDWQKRIEQQEPLPLASSRGGR